MVRTATPGRSSGRSVAVTLVLEILTVALGLSHLKDPDGKTVFSGVFSGAATAEVSLGRDSKRMAAEARRKAYEVEKEAAGATGTSAV